MQDGESIHVVPEEVQKEVPPSYAVAQADSAPAYYETIIHAPSSGLDGEVLVDAMREHLKALHIKPGVHCFYKATGSIFTFAWTMLISLSFQFVGFLLTYLLHTYVNLIIFSLPPSTFIPGPTQLSSAPVPDWVSQSFNMPSSSDDG